MEKKKMLRYYEVLNGTEVIFESLDSPILQLLLKKNQVVPCDIDDVLVLFKDKQELLDDKDLVYSVLQPILKSIAKYLDLGFEDHILNSEELYFFNTYTGRIEKLNSSQRVSLEKAKYIPVPLFRNMTHARIACKIVKPLLNKLYDKQKGKKC